MQPVLSRFIDEVVRGLNFVFAYVDDLQVASDTEENHVKYLTQLFERLCTYQVRMNAVKQKMQGRQLSFPGYL